MIRDTVGANCVRPFCILTLKIAVLGRTQFVPTDSKFAFILQILIYRIHYATFTGSFNPQINIKNKTLTFYQNKRLVMH